MSIVTNMESYLMKMQRNGLTTDQIEARFIEELKSIIGELSSNVVENYSCRLSETQKVLLTMESVIANQSLSNYARQQLGFELLTHNTKQLKNNQSLFESEIRQMKANGSTNDEIRMHIQIYLNECECEVKAKDSFLNFKLSVHEHAKLILNAWKSGLKRSKYVRTQLKIE